MVIFQLLQNPRKPRAVVLAKREGVLVLEFPLYLTLWRVQYFISKTRFSRRREDTVFDRDFSRSNVFCENNAINLKNTKNRSKKVVFTRSGPESAAIASQAWVRLYNHQGRLPKKNPPAATRYRGTFSHLKAHNPSSPTGNKYIPAIPNVRKANPPTSPNSAQTHQLSCLSPAVTR